MKKSLLFFAGIASFLLVGCSGSPSSSSTSTSIHEHTFASDWSYDETHHWHAATCEHTDVKGDYEEHTFVPDEYQIEEICKCGKRHILISSLDTPTGLEYANNKVTWTAVTNALEYSVSVKQGEKSIATATVTSTEYNASSLTAGDYDIYVTAKRGQLSSAAAKLSFSVLYVDGDIKLEAEDAALNSKHISIDPQASGGAYALALNDCGQGLYFRYYAYEAGSRDITITYSTAVDNPKHGIYVNGSKSQDVTYTENTGWFGDTHITADVTVTITGFVLGWNEIYLKVDLASNYVQIDYIQIKGTNKEFNIGDFDFTINSMNLQAECFNYHYSNKDTRPVSGDITKFEFGYFLGAIDASGDGGKLQYTAPCDGDFDIYVGYAASGSRDLSVVVNSEAAQTINVSGSTDWDDVVSRKVGTITLVKGQAFSIDVSRPSTGDWFCFDYINLVRVAD